MLNAYPAIDGFSFQRDLKCDYTLKSLAVEQFDKLRRVGNFRQKQWVFPNNMASQTVPAFDSIEKTLRVGIGAVIWGYQISGASEGGNTIKGFQVRDSCNDQAIFSEPHTQQFARWPGDPTGFNGVILFPRLLVIGSPGILTVELMNTSSENLAQEIVLYGGAPVGVDQ